MITRFLKLKPRTTARFAATWPVPSCRVAGTSIKCAPQQLVSRKFSCSSPLRRDRRKSQRKMALPRPAKLRNKRHEKSLDHLPKGTSQLLRIADRLHSARNFRRRFWVLLLERRRLFHLYEH